MALMLRYSAIAVLVSTAAGAALGRMPSQTIGRFGEPIFALPLPTEPPSLELAKRRLERKDVTVTNICTEWTIPGGFGQPECGNYETCLFTSANGFNYEGCGQTSIAYNWVTECFNYPQSGVPPVSQIYCPAIAPYCGYFAFVFGVDYTFWNYGCSTEPYKLFVDLISSTTGGGSTPIVLAGGGTSQITPTATTVYVTKQPSNTGATATVLLPPGASQSSLSTSKASTPIGAIVGGVIGGIALIAFLSFLAWFYLRKRRQDKAFAIAEAQNQQQQRADAAAAAAAAAARQNANRLSEMGGMQPHSPRTGMYPGKPMDEIDNRHLGSQSPAPSYPHSPQSRSSVPSPPSNYTELEAQRIAAGRSPTNPEFWQTGQGGEQQEINELGGTNRGSWNVPPGVQEMSARMGGINQRPVGPQRPGPGGQYVDMRGAPLSEGYRSHELE